MNETEILEGWKSVPQKEHDDGSNYGSWFEPGMTPEQLAELAAAAGQLFSV